jgi:integrase/recombinase XerD
MSGKQAKTLTNSQIARALRFARQGRYPERNTVMILLSSKAGLRAGEIAKLTWPMVLTSAGTIGSHIELTDEAAKKRSGRTIPIHPVLGRALVGLRAKGQRTGPVIASERGQSPMRPSSVVNWFKLQYAGLGFDGCSSHSGRRTFITKAARMVYRAGGSLRDVQQLAGHSSMEQTQAYIEGDEAAKRRLVSYI